jgi:iron complex outermembrane recepter protein
MGVVFELLFGCAVVQASEPDVAERVARSPARLLTQAVLEYPEEAEGEDLHGDVTVIVDVDKDGVVSAVEVISGHHVFHEAAIRGANTLRFEPAQVRGEPVPARVRVFFHFAPPLSESDHEPIEVIVHALDPDRADTRSRTTLDAAVLEQSTGEDLAESLAQVSGVSVARGTSDTSKPLIRGQQERRLLVLYDGIRHEGQKWGPDHATEIDPFAAGSISVIRGAAGARYGPDAMGGVILVEPPPMRTAAGVGGKVVTAFATNGARPYGAARLDGVFKGVPDLSLRAEGNYTRGASLMSPDYVLGNTGSEQWNAGAALAYRWTSGELRGSYHHHDLRAGVFYGVQNSTPAEFVAQLEQSRPVTADLWSTSYEIDRPYQDVSHDIAVLKGQGYGSWGRFVANYAYQHNVRREFEQARESVSGPQYDFLLRTHSLDGVYEHPERHLGHAHFEGSFGAQGSFQENVYQGLPLLPNYRALELGVFGVERMTLHRVDIEFGARYDRRAQSAYLGRQDFERHTRRETLDEERCAFDGEVAKCPDQWQSGSFSLGGLVHVVPDVLDVKIDLSTATRFPDVDEQYLIGSAPSFPVYGLGYPDLQPENTYGGSLTLGLRQPWIALELSGFQYLVNNYVNFAPALDSEGNPQIDVTIQGAWPTYAYSPIQASLVGADGSLELGGESFLGLALGGALVRQTNTKSGAPLNGTPPDRLRLGLLGRPPGFWLVREPKIGLSAELVAEQTRVDPSADFAPPPGAYALLGAQMSARIKTKDRVLRFGVEAHNLLNTSYRDYTSLLRYYADQPGRNIRLRVAVEL